MNRVRRAIYALVIGAALAVVVGGKCPALGKHFLPAAPAVLDGGDLYRLSELDRFREPIRVLAATPTAPMEKADVLTMGDSFFNSSLESDLFANELARKGGLAVHNIALTPYFEPCSYPLAYLGSIGYRSDRRRVLLLETVERSTLERAVRYCAGSRISPPPVGTLAAKVFDNGDVVYFFKNNVVVHPLIKWLKNARFEWFGSIDGAIGAASEDPDMLFLRSDLDFAGLAKSDAVLDGAADRIARLADLLRHQFNLELLYVVVPDKYSLYRDYLRGAKPYDRYIPRLVERLHARGVHALDMYSVYRAHRRTDGPLFFVSDTHYTAAGKAVLVEECRREIALMASGRSK